jgi:hypothetical protein
MKGELRLELRYPTIEAAFAAASVVPAPKSGPVKRLASA